MQPQSIFGRSNFGSEPIFIFNVHMFNLLYQLMSACNSNIQIPVKVVLIVVDVFS